MARDSMAQVRADMQEGQLALAKQIAALTDAITDGSASRSEPTNEQPDESPASDAKVEAAGFVLATGKGKKREAHAYVQVSPTRDGFIELCSLNTDEDGPRISAKTGNAYKPARITREAFAALLDSDQARALLA